MSNTQTFGVTYVDRDKLCAFKPEAFWDDSGEEDSLYDCFQVFLGAKLQFARLPVKISAFCSDVVVEYGEILKTLESEGVLKVEYSSQDFDFLRGDISQEQHALDNKIASYKELE